jgi:transmembrane sensor
LAPGERLQLGSDARPEIDRPSLTAVTAWRRGQVILDETPLAQAVEEMNRYSNVKLSVADPKAAAIPISGLFQAGDSVIFAHAIAKTNGLHLVQRTNEIELAHGSL